jgi:hypothetical protein
MVMAARMPASHQPSPDTNPPKMNHRILSSVRKSVHSFTITAEIGIPDRF